MRGMARTGGRKHAQGRTCEAKPPLRLRGFVTSCETSRRPAIVRDIPATSRSKITHFYISLLYFEDTVKGIKRQV